MQLCAKSRSHKYSPANISLLHAIGVVSKNSCGVFLFAKRRTVMERKSLLVAILISAGSIAAIPQSFAAAGSISPAYVYDSAGIVARDGNGNCVRTSAWSPELANAECNPELFPSKAAEAAPPAAEPAAPPAAEIAAIEPRKEISISEKAQFDFDQAVLKAEDKQRLDQALVQIKDLPEGAT